LLLLAFGLATLVGPRFLLALEQAEKPTLLFCRRDPAAGGVGFLTKHLPQLSNPIVLILGRAGGRLLCGPGCTFGNRQRR
jgi:hypothetical protein